MKTRHLLVLLAFVAQSFAVNAESTIVPSNHESLAQHHLSLVDEAKVKLQEHKNNLEDYELHSYYYGRGGQDFRSHETANVRLYEEIIAENLKQAEFHQQMAEAERNQINKANINNFAAGEVSSTESTH
ncbi:MAG TPA: hypothetical protein PKD35_06470 [Nitrosomonas sp.]|nr:hypothetical protein [Nitrosomonas sp.]